MLACNEIQKIHEINSKGGSMKKLFWFLVSVLLLVILQTTAICMEVPSWCEDCVQLSWEDMGEFLIDSDGNETWIWQVEGFLEWFTNIPGGPGPDADPDKWQPKKELTFKDPRFEVRTNNADWNSRFVISIEDGISYPIIFKQDYPEGSDFPYNIYVYNYIGPGGCDDYLGNNQWKDNCWCSEHYPDYRLETSDGNDCETTPGYYWDPWDPSIIDALENDGNVDPCCKPWRQPQRETKILSEFSPDRIEKIVWEETGEEVSGTQAYVNQGHITGMNYSLYPDNKWKQSYDLNYREIVFQFPSGMRPEVLGVQTITMYYDNGKIKQFKFDVKNLDPMPVVPATVVETQTVYTKSGKMVKGLSDVQTTIDNMKTRELDTGELVIQWAEPDLALRGGLQLRVYVGADFSSSINDPNYMEEFLWIDCPVQIGTVVIPTDQWSILKSQIEAKNQTEAKIFLSYRHISWSDEFQTTSMNRSYSSTISYPIY